MVIYPDASEPAGATAASKCPVEGWSYEISRGGMGFVCEGKLVLESVVIGLDLDEETPIWMRASVKHCRELMDEVYGCGVQFTGRADPPV